MPSILNPFTTAAKSSSRRRALSDLLAPLDEIAAKSHNISVQQGEPFEVNGERYEIPRYLFTGPQGGDAPIRVGIFAALHGDEPEGAHAAVQFLKLLESRPSLATGYSLSVFPVCNPTGYEDNTRHSRRGKDLNREFWNNSGEPEVRLLQADLISHSYHGIISLHTDDTADGFYGFVSGATLTRHLIEPALRVVETLVPRDRRSSIDGFNARDGVIRDGYAGVLSAPPKVRPKPFEIILETSKAPPALLRECAFVLALETILTEYRKFIAYAQNL
jgi:protein MpaA